MGASGLSGQASTASHRKKIEASLLTKVEADSVAAIIVERAVQDGLNKE
jgi:hypothetical protein